MEYIKATCYVYVVTPTGDNCTTANVTNAFVVSGLAVVVHTDEIEARQSKGLSLLQVKDSEKRVASRKPPETSSIILTLQIS